MPLNLSVGDGDFTPYIKYNAKAGRWYVKPEGATEEVEIVNPALAFDKTMAITEVARGPAAAPYSGTATAIPVDDTLWLSSFFADRVAYRSLKR